MGSIHKRGKRFQVKWRNPDGSQRGRTFSDYATAKEHHIEVERCERRGVRWEPRDACAVPGLRAIWEAYLREVSLIRRPRTIERYGLHLEVFMRWLQQREGARTKLTSALLSKRLFVDYYRDLEHFECRNGGRNLDTRRRMVEDVILAWEWAENDDEYGEVVPRPRRLKLGREPGNPTVAPTWKESMACVMATQGWHRQVAGLLYYTGLRVQQVMMLRWEDFDLDHAVLSFRGELGKSEHERKGRLEPVSTHLVAELMSWGPGLGFIVQSGRARGGPRERMFRARDMSRAWARAGVRALAWQGQPNHAFRKGFITNLKRAGADNEAVEFLVGHKLPGQRDIYVDPDAHPLRKAVGFIPALPVVLPFPCPREAEAG